MESQGLSMPTLLRSFKQYSPIEFGQTSLSRSLLCDKSEEELPEQDFSEKDAAAPKRLKFSNIKLNREAYVCSGSLQYQTPVKKVIFQGNNNLLEDRKDQFEADLDNFNSGSFAL